MEAGTPKDFNAPPPTLSELKLRSVLRSRKMPFKDGQVIWYTSCDKYTPDLVVGKRLIIEVDGKIHDREYQKTPDRIRQRALENMGYVVLRVRNEHIQNMPDIVADKIIQRYFEVSDVEHTTAKITKLNKPLDYEPVPKKIDENLPIWAVEFSKELSDERWSISFFKENLARFHPKLVTNQCAVERLILLLLGLNLKGEDGNLDFEFSLNFLQKSMGILKGLFGEGGISAAVHLKNMYNISAPGFFKNLIFKGGPNINPGIISIRDTNTLNNNIDNFNKNFSHIGITVERSEIGSEINVILKKLDENEISKYDWLKEWVNKP